MNFEIDVSGEDLLSKNYVICIANKDGIIKGFKFSEKLVKVLSSKYGQGFYRYQKSKKGKSLFKVRLYSIVIYYLFKSLKKGDLSLDICRDFTGKENENDIRKTLKFFLEDKLDYQIDDRIYFTKLNNDSNAHIYSFLMRHDKKNKMDTYVKITLEDFEKWLKK
jgi:hypothetical protein